MPPNSSLHYLCLSPTPLPRTVADGAQIDDAQNKNNNNDKTATAAAQWGRIVGGRPPFEDVALRLLEAGDPDALAAFLEARLRALGRSDRAQAALAASWLLELLLDAANRAALAAGGDASDARVATAGARLKAFLTEHAAALDAGTAAALLASYGRLEELRHFAAARGDDEALLEQLTAAGGGGGAEGAAR